MFAAIKRLLVAGVFFGTIASAYAQSTPVGLGNEAAAGTISTTDTFPICQSGSGGCPTGNTSQKLKAATASQMATFIATQGFAMLASPTFTGTPAAPTAAQSVSTASTQIASVAFVKAQAITEPTASWLVGASPNNGVLLGRSAQARTIQAIYCRPMVSGDSGATIDVYYAASGTGGASGTKIDTTSCNPNGTVNTDQSLLSAPVNIPAQNTVYLVATGTFAASAGSVSAQVTTQ